MQVQKDLRNGLRIDEPVLALGADEITFDCFLILRDAPFGRSSGWGEASRRLVLIQGARVLREAINPDIGEVANCLPVTWG